MPWPSLLQMDPCNTPCKDSEIDLAMDVGPQQLRSHPNPVTLYSHLPVVGDLLPLISYAITAQWDLDGVLALSLRTGYAGSRDRMDKGSMSVLTMRPVPRKAFCAKYVHSCLITWSAGSQSFTTVLHRGGKHDYQCGWHTNGVWESLES